MARADLLALSFEDLVALTNRGTVKPPSVSSKRTNAPGHWTKPWPAT